MVRFLTSWWWKLGLVALALVVTAQLVPYRVDNPPVSAEPAWDSPETRDLAVRACYDCHSNETDVLWFEHVAPISWYITNHVREGRAALNFSEWDIAPGEEADDAAEAVADGEMPPGSYTRFGLHGDARLSDREREALIDGLERTLEDDPPDADRADD